MSNNPIRNARHAVMPGIRKFQSKSPAQVANWKSWAYTNGSCQIQDGKTVIGAGMYHPMGDSINLVEPDGAGITNTIGRAELAAIAAALTQEYTHCHGQPQLTSPTQKANPLTREAQASCARKYFKEIMHLDQGSPEILIEQTVPPWEPSETEVVPGSSPCDGEKFVQVFAPRMTPFLN
eukprot:1146550-Pelagomonas_calceolata.AAC.3